MMKKNLFLFNLLFIAFSSFAQNVGIGTTTPANKLQVIGDVAADSMFLGDATNNPLLQFKSNSSGKKIVLWPPAPAGEQYDGFGLDLPFMRYQVYSTTVDHAFFAATNATTANELMRIKGNGNVGIGTSDPHALLQFGNVNTNRIAVLYELANNDHQFDGFGVNTDYMRYQINGTNVDHAFFAGTSATTSNELMRIKGNGNVGIGTSAPTSKLNVNGQITIDEKNFGGYGGLLIKGNVPGNNYPNVGFSITNTAGSDVIGAVVQGDLVNNTVGNESIDLSFSTTAAGFSSLSRKLLIKGNGNIGINENNPGFPLNFTSTLGDKISLWGNAGSHYGFGVQAALLQIHANQNTDNIAFGYGSSSNFTERARIINSGTDGMILKGRLHLQNGSVPLNTGQTGGLWLYKADNSALLSFMGTQSNNNVGFYGGPVNAGWGFVYDAINSRVGVGTSTPQAALDVAGYTVLGESSAKIKMMRLSIFTNALDGGVITLIHGLNPAKILHVGLMIETASNTFYPEDYTAQAGYQVQFNVLANSLQLRNVAGNCSNVLGKPVKVNITYEE